MAEDGRPDGREAEERGAPREAVVIAVKFRGKDGGAAKTYGREYNYRLDADGDVAPGDWIKVPVGDAGAKALAMVTQRGVPDGKVDARVAGRLRTITEIERADPDGEGSAGTSPGSGAKASA